MSSQSMWGSEVTQYFFELSPQRVLEAVESLGTPCTGRVLTLNSFENRVYEVELLREDVSWPKRDPRRFVVVKFYRPGRWTREQIQDELSFLKDLEEADVPVVAPLDHRLHQEPHTGLWFCVYPKHVGRRPDEPSLDDYRQMGRLQARIHTVGRQNDAPHRVRMTAQSFGEDPLQYLVSHQVIPREVESLYRPAAEAVVTHAHQLLPRLKLQRVHGDCHLGNLLDDQGRFTFLDFDDMVVGPRIQDTWLLFSQPAFWMSEAFMAYREGYATLGTFDATELEAVPVLRALRLLHYTAWVYRRLDDPAFHEPFAHVRKAKYFEDQLPTLRQALLPLASIEELYETSDHL